MNELTPITRIESWLDAIVDGATPPLDDVTRIETFLAAIYNNNVCELTPVTRIEMFLGAISGQDIELPEPVTRIEIFLAKVAGADIVTPEPVTRVEYWLAQWAEGGQPEYATISGAIVEFVTRRAAELKSCVVTLEPKQDLHGYDSPWPAGGGKNLCALNDFTATKKDVTFEYVNGKMIVNGTPQSAGWFGIGERFKLPAGTYTVSYKVSGSNSAIKIGFDNFAGYIQFNTAGTQSRTFTLSEETIGILDLSCDQTTTYANTEILIQIETGSTATTWSPFSNICPISGWTGCEVWDTGHNMWDEEWELGYLDPSTGRNASSNDCIRAKNYSAISPNTSYYVKVPSGSGVNCKLFFYDADKAFISWTTRTNEVFPTPSNARYFRFFMANQYGTTYNHDISINYPSTDTEYHPYNGDSYSVTWEDEVFGGSAEVVTGKRTNDRTKLKLLSSFAWQMDGTTGSDKRYGVQYSSNPSVIKAINQNGTYISNMLAPGNIGLNSHEFGTFYISNSWIVVHDKNSHFATLDDFKDWLDTEDVYLVYKVDTPVETDITPTPISTLKGYNAMWSNGGDITVTVRGTPVEVETLQALNMLLGGAYHNEQTADDVSDDEALDIILGGENE